MTRSRTGSVSSQQTASTMYSSSTIHTARSSHIPRSSSTSDLYMDTQFQPKSRSKRQLMVRSMIESGSGPLNQGNHKELKQQIQNMVTDKPSLQAQRNRMQETFEFPNGEVYMPRIHQRNSSFSAKVRPQELPRAPLFMVHGNTSSEQTSDASSQSNRSQTANFDSPASSVPSVDEKIAAESGQGGHGSSGHGRLLPLGSRTRPKSMVDLSPTKKTQGLLNSVYWHGPSTYTGASEREQHTKHLPVSFTMGPNTFLSRSQTPPPRRSPESVPAANGIDGPQDPTGGVRVSPNRVINTSPYNQRLSGVRGRSVESPLRVSRSDSFQDLPLNGRLNSSSDSRLLVHSAPQGPRNSFINAAYQDNTASTPSLSSDHSDTVSSVHDSSIQASLSPQRQSPLPLSPRRQVKLSVSALINNNSMDTLLPQSPLTASRSCSSLKSLGTEPPVVPCRSPARPASPKVSQKPTLGRSASMQNISPLSGVHASSPLASSSVLVPGRVPKKSASMLLPKVSENFTPPNMDTMKQIKRPVSSHAEFKPSPATEHGLGLNLRHSQSTSVLNSTLAEHTSRPLTGAVTNKADTTGTPFLSNKVLRNTSTGVPKKPTETSTNQAPLKHKNSLGGFFKRLFHIKPKAKPDTRLAAVNKGPVPASVSTQQTSAKPTSTEITDTQDKENRQSLPRPASNSGQLMDIDLVFDSLLVKNESHYNRERLNQINQKLQDETLNTSVSETSAELSGTQIECCNSDTTLQDQELEKIDDELRQQLSGLEEFIIFEPSQPVPPPRSSKRQSRILFQNDVHEWKLHINEQPLLDPIACAPGKSNLRTASTSKRITFSKSLYVNDTWASGDYDRKGGYKFAARYLSPESINKIKMELNYYKMNEMPVHQNSQTNTHFFIC